MSVRPRHVLITGGSRGIGLAIAQLFAKSSYRCTLISRSEEALKHAVSTLQPLDVPVSSPSITQLPDSDSTTPPPDLDLTKPPPDASKKHSDPSPSPYTHAYIAGDITMPTQFWGPKPNSHFGAVNPPGTLIDVLVNCAGVSQSALFIKTGDENINDILNLNLNALMSGTRFLLRGRYLRGDKLGSTSANKGVNGEKEGRKGSPVIINIASLLGISGGYGAVAYAASKAGVLGFTRALATEYASHRVRVNAVVPGYIETDMTKGLDEDALRQRIPLGRFGKAEEVAQAALFLAENDYAHNCVVNLDGGLSAV